MRVLTDAGSRTHLTFTDLCRMRVRRKRLTTVSFLAGHPDVRTQMSHTDHLANPKRRVLNRLSGSIFVLTALGFWAGIPRLAVAQEQPEAVSVQPTAAPSFTQLGNPDVAKRLGLSDEQRQKVADLLEARQQALAETDPQARAEVEAQFETQLRDVLTAEQLDQWGKSPSNPDVQLRFNFRFQPWIDVLSWFAEQANLSLVLDAPPPGTFNYTDARSYSVSEAIDLLNGVLLTKGFTLIRRDRMLVVANLADGLPLDLIPTIPLEELENRGEFEIVRTSIPLEGRDPEEVRTEIEPLVGPNGKFDVLPKTGQVLIADAASRVRAIHAVIQSIPLPKKPSQPEPKPEPEKPVLATYPSGNVDPTAALETFEALMPGIKVVYDSNTSRFVVYAVPSQQTALQKALEQMRAGREPESKPEVRTYDLLVGNAASIAEMLSAVAPAAQAVPAEDPQRLIVFAAPPDHEAIQQALERLQHGTDVAGDMKVQVYSLEHATPEVAQAALSALFPAARISADLTTRRLLVAARESEQQAIATLITQFDAPAEAERQLKVLALPEGVPSSVTSLLSTLAPEAQINVDASGRQLIVIASSEDVTNIEDTLEGLAAATSKGERPEPRVYSVDPPLARRLVEVLSALAAELPRLSVVSNDPALGELTILAPPADHDVVAQLIEQLRGEVSPEAKLRVASYPIHHAAPENVLSVLQALLPDVQFVVDSATSRITARAREEDHETIRTTIEEIDVELPPEKRPRLSTHSLEDASSELVLSVLTTLLPQAQLTPDSENKSLVALASDDEHQLIDEVIARLQPSVDPETRPVMEVYSVRDADPRTVAEIVQNISPEVRVSADPSSGKLAVWATAQQQELVKTTVEKMRAEFRLEDRRRVEVYRLERAESSAAVSILQSIAPEARVIADSAAGTVVAWAKEDEHAAIRRTIDEMEAARGEEEGRQLAVYPLEQNLASNLISVIQPGVPRATLTYDAPNRSLIAWANAHDQALIQQAVDRLESGGEELLAERQLVVYPLAHNVASNVISILQPSTPNARLTYDSTNTNLLAFATEGEHETIAQAVEELESQVGQSAQREGVVYDLGKIPPSTATSMLQAVLPSAKFASDANSGALIVWAKPDEHAMLEKSFSALREKIAANPGKESRVYRFRNADPVDLYRAVAEMFPEARLSPDRSTRTLIVTAAADEQEQIAKVIEQIRQQTEADDGAMLKLYTVRTADPRVLENLLEDALPSARIEGDRDTRTLSVWGTPEEHATIQDAITQFDVGLPADKRPQVVSYPLRGVQLSEAVDLLEEAFPNARFVGDEASQTLLAWAAPQEQQSIQQAVEQFRAGVESGESGLETKVYRFRNASPSSALPALQALLPAVSMSVDTATSSLIATGRDAEHARLAEAIAQLEGDEADSAPTLKSYAITDSEPQSVLTILEQLFATRPEVRLTLDEGHRRLIAWALPEQHQTIAATLAEIRSSIPEASLAQVEVYPLKDADPEAVETVLSDLFRDAPAVEIVVDAQQKQIIAVADPEQHATIRATIDQMQGPPREVAVIPLRILDPFTAELTIEELFGIDLRRPSPGDPVVEADYDNQQLIIRASKEDLEEIRQLLAKMGETGLGGDLAGDGRNFRVLPLSEREARQALEELRRIWPQLRPNPIRVVTPSAVAPSVRQSRDSVTEPTESQGDDQTDENSPASTDDEQASGETGTDTETNLDESAQVRPARAEAAGRVVHQGAGLSTADNAKNPNRRPNSVFQLAVYADESEDESAAEVTDDSPTAEDAQPDESEASPAAEPSPIVVAPGPAGLTIASDDTEALNQFESLLNALIERRGTGGRDYTIFQLRNANAALVADTLQKLFDGGSPLRGLSSVSIVPDARLNALIVQGNRNDLAAIEGLVESLDTSEVPETLVAPRPKLIPLENARAEEVADVLRDVYREELRARQQSQLPVPRGVSQDLAAVLQSFNAQQMGPALSVGVDQDSNSLVISAAPTLMAEVEKLVANLDETAARLTRSVRVIPLQRTDAETVEAALRILLPESSSRGRRGR